MPSKQLIQDLEKAFKKEEDYKFLEYIDKNAGVFISAISIISAIVLFVARAISFLVVNAQYRYWGLDDGFIVEDNKVFLKLVVYVLYFILLLVLNAFAKRYVYCLEFYNCELYLYGKIFSDRDNNLKMKKKAIQEMKKWVTDIEKSDEPLHEDRLVQVKNELARLEQENKELRKDCFESKIEVFKIWMSIIARFIFAFLIIYGASLLLQLFSGVDIRSRGAAGLAWSTFIVALIFMISVIISAFLEIKLMLKVVIKRSFNDEKIVWNSDYIKPVIEWLQTKSEEQKNQSIKVFFSDSSLKKIVANLVLTTFLVTIFLQINVSYSLERMDTFYIYKENQQDYVMLINDGTKYIFSECDINDNELTIDNNTIIVRNEPIKLEKQSFGIVHKIE